MVDTYYQIPLKLGEMIHQQEHEKCSLSKSVATMLHLVLITNLGECKFDEGFGCEIWEHDFENIANIQLYKEKLRKSIKQTIEKYEPRLNITRFDIQIEQIENRVNNRRTKSRISLYVKGTLIKTNEVFTYSEQFFIGPLSYML
ncbi:GPW/gp25 family protein [Labilibacter sediminis]|nr:GPW/gp25 family protein [Labilibacter sediminis]